MNIGSLNRRVTIKKLTDGQDAIGQPVQTWTDVATVWANIKHKNGAETIRADQDVSIVQASIRIRYRTGVTAAMRVHHDSVIYEIKAVVPDAEGREFVDLVCERVNG